MADVHSRFIGLPYWYDGHRLDPSDLDLKAYIDERIAANQNGSSSPGGSSYLVYSNNLTQSGTSAPTGEPSINTLGTVTLNYDNSGAYYLGSDGLFTNGKTEVFINQTETPNNAIFRAYYQDENSIIIETWEANGDGTYSLGNGYLDNTSVKVIVYP